MWIHWISTYSLILNNADALIVDALVDTIDCSFCWIYWIIITLGRDLLHRCDICCTWNASRTYFVAARCNNLSWNVTVFSCTSGQMAKRTLHTFTFYLMLVNHSHDTIVQIFFVRQGNATASLFRSMNLEPFQLHQ